MLPQSITTPLNQPFLSLFFNFFRPTLRYFKKKLYLCTRKSETCTSKADMHYLLRGVLIKKSRHRFRS